MQNCTNPATPSVGHDGLVAIITATATSVVGIIGAIIVNNRQPIINFISGLICKQPIVAEKPKEEVKTDIESQIPPIENNDYIVKDTFRERITVTHTRSRSNSNEINLPTTPRTTPRRSLELDQQKSKDLVEIHKL